VTDWLPWGAVVMAGTFSTLGLTLRAVGRAPAGQAPDLRAARWALLATVLLSLAVYSLYLLTGEDWVWYLH
jgi:hypothetical protein